MKTIKDIIKTEAQILEVENTSVENNEIKSFELILNQHFNAVTLSGSLHNCGFGGSHNNTSNVGYIFRAMVELFELKSGFDDIIKPAMFINLPIRAVFKNQRLFAIGHFMTDKFVIVDELFMLGVQ